MGWGEGGGYLAMLAHIYTYHVMFEFNFSRLQSFHQVSVVARCQSCLVIQNGHTSSNTVSSYKFFLGWKVQVLIQDWSNMIRERYRTDWMWICRLCVALSSFDPLLIEECFALNRKAWKQSNRWICEQLQEVQLSWLRREQAWWMRPPRLCSSTSATIQKHNSTKTTQKSKNNAHVFTCSSAPRHVAWSSDPGFEKYFKQSLKS